MNQMTNAVRLLLLLSCMPVCQADETPATAGPAFEPPQLQPVFSDDFSNDTRADYSIKGDVSWEPGKLTLAEGASIERAINGGPWAKVELDLEHVPLTTEQPTSELRVWFMLEGATNCYVRLRRQLEDGKTISSMALVDTGEMDGKSMERVVRTINVDDATLDSVRVEYRRGLIWITTQDDQWFAAYIENGSATVGSVSLQTVSTAVEFRNFSAAAIPANKREFTKAEQKELAKASAANDQIVTLYGEGKSAAAAEIGEQVLDIDKSVLGEQHPDYATSLHNLAFLYESMGDSARAEPLYRQALDIKKSVLGEQHPAYAVSLDNLAGLYFRKGDSARAEPLYKQALNIRKSVLGEQNLDYANSLENLGFLYDGMGDSTRAEPLYRQALDIKKSVLGEQNPDYAKSLDNVALLYFRKGDSARAETLYRQALNIRKSVLGEQNPAYAASLNNLAGLYESVGDSTRAEPLYRQALKIQKSVYGEQHPDYATSLHNLAFLYESMGDSARAEPLYRQALDIKKSVLGEQHPNYALSLCNLAGLYGSTGDFARAEPLFKQARDIFKSVLGEQHPDYATSLHNLAFLYESMGDSARAEPLYRQALDIKKSVLGEQNPAYARSLDNLALLYFRKGDSARAEPLHKQALEIRKSVLGEQHPEYATSLNNLAALYANMGDSARAEPLYKEARDIFKSVHGEDHSDFATSLNNLAGLYTSMGDSARAELLYKQALRVQRTRLDVNELVQSARQQNRNQAFLRFYLDNRLANAVILEPLATEPLENLWQWKGAVTTRQQAYRQVAANPQLAPLFEELQSVTRHLSALDGQRPVPPAETASDEEETAFEQRRQIWTDRFAALSRQAEDLEQQIAAGSEEFRRIQKPLTVAQVKRWLPAGTAFVDFLEYRHGTPNAEQKGKVNYERRYIAFVVRHDKEPAMIGLGSSASIAEAIMAFRRPFQSDQSTPEDRKLAAAAANQLRRDLWLPVEAHLEGIDTVIISPDTALGTLPFAALPGKTDGSYLLEDYRIAMIPMASQLRELFEHSPETRSNNGLLVLGDVDYDAPPGAPESPAPSAEPLLADSMIRREAGKLRAGHAGQWTSLSGFRAELEAITTLYASQHSNESATVLSRDKASEATFLTEAPRFRTLHLITHGYFEDPSVKSIAQADVKQDTMLSEAKGPDPFINTYLPGLLSGLAMAGANLPSNDPEDPHDGILRSSEIEASSMQGVDLVVLSACETGLGAVAGGEGLSGLQRAFQVAGARSVVASLWKVDDAATLALMTEFYTNLWVKKQSKIDALRNAQLTMLRSYDPKTNTLRRGLGTKPGKVAAAKQDTEANPDVSEFRLDPALWAAFQLSGDWR